MDSGDLAGALSVIHTGMERLRANQSVRGDDYTDSNLNQTSRQLFVKDLKKLIRSYLAHDYGEIDMAFEGLRMLDPDGYRKYWSKLIEIGKMVISMPDDADEATVRTVKVELDVMWTMLVVYMAKVLDVHADDWDRLVGGPRKTWEQEADALETFLRAATKIEPRTASEIQAPESADDFSRELDGLKRLLDRVISVGKARAAKKGIDN